MHRLFLHFGSHENAFTITLECANTADWGGGAPPRPIRPQHDLLDPLAPPGDNGCHEVTSPDGDMSTHRGERAGGPQVGGRKNSQVRAR